jgi:hypothetical protein
MPEGHQSPGGGFEQKIIAHLLIVKIEGMQLLVGKGEDHVVVWHSKEVVESFPDPDPSRHSVAYGTIEIVTGAVRLFATPAHVPEEILASHRKNPAHPEHSP